MIQLIFNLDCILRSCDDLIKHVTILFKWFLRTAFLLLCNVVPIVKDNLGDIATSDNHRAIAIGILLLKHGLIGLSLFPKVIN